MVPCKHKSKDITIIKRKPLYGEIIHDKRPSVFDPNLPLYREHERNVYLSILQSPER